MSYSSQYKQDYWIDKLLRRKRNGFFFDIGANDGVTISNTLFFERNRKWDGICVEPIEDVYVQLLKNRKCEVINACVSDKIGSEIFFCIRGHNEMLSGLKSQYNEQHWNRIMKDIKITGDEVSEYEVRCLTANQILEKHQNRIIDVLSIDTEGSELKILTAIDFNKFIFSVICVENPYHDHSFEKLLHSKGYILCKILSCDYLFINTRDISLLLYSLPFILMTNCKIKFSNIGKFMKKVLKNIVHRRAPKNN